MLLKTNTFMQLKTIYTNNLNYLNPKNSFNFFKSFFNLSRPCERKCSIYSLNVTGENDSPQTTIYANVTDIRQSTNSISIVKKQRDNNFNDVIT